MPFNFRLHCTGVVPVASSKCLQYNLQQPSFLPGQSYAQRGAYAQPSQSFAQRGVYAQCGRHCRPRRGLHCCRGFYGDYNRFSVCMCACAHMCFSFCYFQYMFPFITFMYLLLCECNDEFVKCIVTTEQCCHVQALLCCLRYARRSSQAQATAIYILFFVKKDLLRKLDITNF
jgi:hypothetical protein